MVVMSGTMLEDSLKKEDFQKNNTTNPKKKKKKPKNLKNKCGFYFFFFVWVLVFFPLMVRDPSCVTRSRHTLCQQLAIANAKISKYILIFVTVVLGFFKLYTAL